jgi:hypothetical protein
MIGAKSAYPSDALSGTVFVGWGSKLISFNTQDPRDRRLIYERKPGQVQSLNMIDRHRILFGEGFSRRIYLFHRDTGKVSFIRDGIESRGVGISRILFLASS